MKNKGLKASSAFLCAALAGPALGSADVEIPMIERNTGTFYTMARMGNANPVTADVMIDTGSGYSTINEETLAALKNEALFVRNITGILANGEELTVPIYKIGSYIIGERCELEDVEVAVFRENSRQILGMSALRKVGSVKMGFQKGTPTLTFGPGCNVSAP